MTQDSFEAAGAICGPEPGLSAIIIDDQRGLAESLAERLALDGIRCTVTTTASQGLEACANNNFDVAFVDLNLPDMSGLAAASELKRLSRALRVVLVTGFATGLDDIDLCAPQVDVVLPKPWRPAELENLLHSLKRREQ